MSAIEAQRNRRLIGLALAAPPLLLLCLLAGGGSYGPALLFESELAGILQLRLWRVLLGGLVGAGLAMAGAALQAVLRNPLAEPYVLGISSGAGLGTVAAILAGGLALGVWVQPAAGFIGALLSLAVVYRLACFDGRTSPHTLILAGVVWGSVCASVLFFVVSQSSADGLHAVMWWMLGDLQVFEPDLVKLAGGLILLAGVLLYGQARALNALTFGEEVAGGIGIEPERARRIALALASLLAATAVSVSGLIGFVGLVAPHAMRSWVGPNHRRLLPASALAGALFLVVADAIGRTILYPMEVPVGVFTSVVGGPFFLVLLRRRQKQVWV